MAINLQVAATESKGDTFSITYNVYHTNLYTLNGVGDNIDLQASVNPDGSARNPLFLPNANAPARMPTEWSDNNGDMAGAYVGLKVNGQTLNTLKARFYQANGTELGTGAAYPAGTPGAAAQAQLQLTFTWPQGV